MIKKMAAGNWKMNGMLDSLKEIERLQAAHSNSKIDIVICPPVPLLLPARKKAPDLLIGAQDCHQEVSGAHTGDISASLLNDIGAAAVIIGHSERRQAHAESSALIQQKASAALTAGLTAIICIGETLEQRQAEETLTVLKDQLEKSLPEIATAHNTVVAYEPVWAIGTGLVAEPAQIEEAHRFCRAQITKQLGTKAASMRLLYGGSVKAANAAEIFKIDCVDGALVGGASLRFEDFSPIIEALEMA